VGRLVHVRTLRRQRRHATQAWCASLAIHCTLLASLGVFGLWGRALPPRLTDFSAATDLDLSSFPTGATATPQPTPPPPAPPEPQPEQPEEPAPPEPAVAQSPATDDMADQKEREAVQALIRGALSKGPAGLAVPKPAPPPPAPPAPAEQPKPPTATFAGVEATPARRIVYLVDGSGSMAASINFVKSELNSSIQRLAEDQYFQIIVFRQPANTNQPATVAFARSDMVNASASNKSSVAPWLQEILPVGRSDLTIGLTEAMRFQPDIIFVLSRGISRSGVNVEQRNVDVLNALDRINPVMLNGQRNARIKTIQFIEDDPTGLMQLIAARHGDGEGSYRLVTRDELRRN
jgi:hypothetical protein